MAGKLSVINMKEDTRLPVGATGPRGAGGVSPIKARSIATEEMDIKRKKKEIVKKKREKEKQRLQQKYGSKWRLFGHKRAEEKKKEE